MKQVSLAIAVLCSCCAVAAQPEKSAPSGASVAVNEAWQSTNGPFGGFLYVLTGDSQGRILAGGRHQLFRLADDGTHWINLEMPVADSLVPAALSTPDGQLLAISDHYGYRMSKDGSTWTQTIYDLRGFAVNDKGRIFAYGSGDLRYSDDNGAHWSPAKEGFPTGEVAALKFARGLGGLAVIGKSLFYTLDDGKSWHPVTGAPSPARLYALTGVGGSDVLASFADGIYRAHGVDGSWKTLFPVDSIGHNAHPYVDDGGHVFIGAYDGVYRSADGGKTWEKSVFGPEKSVYYRLALGRSGALYGTNGKGGVYVSKDRGIKWSPVMNGLTAASVNSMLLGKDGSVWAATDSGVYHSKPDFTGWEQSIARAGLTKIVAGPKGELFACGGPNFMERSLDGGKKWEDVRYPGLDQLAVAPSGRIWADGNGGAKGLLYSDDSGNSWTKVNGEVSDSGPTSIAVNAKGHLFVWTTKYRLYRSVDNGQSWKPILNFIGHCLLSCVADGTIYACNPQPLVNIVTVYRSTDNGDTWTQLHVDTKYSEVKSLLVGPKGSIYLGTTKGLYYSADNGIQWEKDSSPAVSTRIESLAFDSSRHVLAGTVANGVYRKAGSAAK
jgi:photosystem II stability/assembly factor-like uncharacterized protein